MTTRETILTELKKHGETRADDLAQPLKLTPMAVRQHLYQLQAEGVVTCVSKPVGRGRPAKLWKLTPKSDIYFPDAHRELSLDMLESIRAVMGEDGLNKLVAHRANKQLNRYQEIIKNSPNLNDKLDKLAAERCREGYMAEVAKAEENSFLLLENHCPICEAAKICSGLCAKELSVFSDLLENEATIERYEHLLSGGRRCAYKITPRP